MLYWALNVTLLVFSLLLTFAMLLLQYQNSLLITKMPKLSAMLQWDFVRFSLYLSLWTYRTLCALKINFYIVYLFLNAIIMVFFYIFRMQVILHPTNYATNSSYFAFFVLFICSGFFALTRMFFRIGFVVNEKHLDNPDIVFIIEQFTRPAVNVFGNIGRRMCGILPINPGTGGVDKHFALGLATFGATAIIVSTGVVVAWDNHKVRLAAEVNAEAAKHSAQAAKDSAQAAKDSVLVLQQKMDIKATKHGLMTPEEYFKNYSGKD